MKVEISYLLVLKDASWTEGESPDQLSAAKEWTPTVPMQSLVHSQNACTTPVSCPSLLCMQLFASGTLSCRPALGLDATHPVSFCPGCLHLCVFGHICSCRENSHVVKLLVLGRSEDRHYLWDDNVTRVQCCSVGGLSQWEFGMHKPGSRDARLITLCPVTERQVRSE